jgi:hypothetical protein
MNVKKPINNIIFIARRCMYFLIYMIHSASSAPLR